MTDWEHINQRIDALREHVDRETAAIRREMAEMRTNATKVFVTNERFSPVEKIVIGAVALILIAFATALIAVVLK